MAGALGLKLNGPKSYKGVLVKDAYMGEGTARRDGARYHAMRSACHDGLGIMVAALLSPPSFCKGEQSLDIDVPREVLGEPVEHGIDARLITLTRRFRSEFRKKRGARIVGREEAVNITAPDAAIGRRCAVGTAIGERDERSRNIRSGCFANVHFVALERGSGSRKFPSTAANVFSVPNSVSTSRSPRPSTVRGRPSMPFGSEIRLPSI